MCLVDHILKCFGEWSDKCSGHDHCCCETQCKKLSVKLSGVKDKSGREVSVGDQLGYENRRPGEVFWEVVFDVQSPGGLTIRASCSQYAHPDIGDLVLIE